MSHDILSECIEQREALARRLDRAKAERDAAKALLREIRASGIVSAAPGLRGRIDAVLESKP